MNSQYDFPVEVSFHNVIPSEFIEAKARYHAGKLCKYFDHIMNCRITIETHHHQHKGNIYHVTVKLGVPHEDLVVNRHPANEDVYVAMRDAFKAIQRKLKDYTAKLRGEMKSHLPQLQGRVLEIAPMSDFGLIQTNDGATFRFSSQSVIDFDFDKLEVGAKVKFNAVDSNTGPAASTVYVK